MPDIPSMEQESDHVGEGLLLWDVERGILVSLEFSCEVTETQTIAMSITFGGQEQAMEQVQTMSGNEKYEVRFDD